MLPFARVPLAWLNLTHDKVRLVVRALGVDLLSISAHKLGGPQGVGALVARDGVALTALQRGGGQERGRRAGTENGPGIVGFGVAAELAAREVSSSVANGSCVRKMSRRPGTIWSRPSRLAYPIAS